MKAMLTLKGYQESALEYLAEYFQRVSSEKDPDSAFYALTKESFGKGIPYHPVPGLEGLPYICLRVPTGGGKTLMACHALHIAQRNLLHADSALVLWLVPSNTIREQTLKALRDSEHPYRRVLDQTLDSVEILDISEALHVRRPTLDTNTTIVVSTIQAFRVDDTEGRKVYEPNGDLMDHFSSPEIFAEGMGCYPDTRKPEPTLANVFYRRSPIVIVDEAHNARTELSFETLTRFNPSCIIEFTATPATRENPSNVLYSASAAELFGENMIKLPLYLTTRTDWKEVLTDAIQQRKALEESAKRERLDTGEYIRPIMLVQAQPKRKGQETLTFELVKKALMEDFGIPEEQIAVSTGTTDELEGADVYSADCPIRYIVTVQKLREGWDCPFAYVLCSLATMKSPTAIEQIVGRVLRLPGAKPKTSEELNSAYTFVSCPDPHFGMVLNSMTDALVHNGFQKKEARDYIVSPDPPSDRELPFENDPLFSDQATVPLPGVKEEQLSNLPEEVKKKVSVDEKGQTLTFRGGMSERDKDALSRQFDTPEGKKAVEEIFRKKRKAFQTAKEKAKTPSERGISFDIPVLSLKQGDLFEQLEKQHFLEFEWKLAQCDPILTEEDYSGKRGKGQKGKVGVDEKGRLKSEHIARVQTQFEEVFNKTDWTEVRLIRWLDRNIPHPDIDVEDAEIYLTRVIRHLISERKFDLFHLTTDKYNLRNAVERKIQAQRAGVHRKFYRQVLFGENSEAKVVTSPENCFSFRADPRAYPYNQLYDGNYRFKKHYYPKIASMGPGEETDCAVFLDQWDEVAFWVRNLERKPGNSFWLQTATDKFYPDFVCRLKDGRNLVVEYKGADRWTNEDSWEKRTLGELWADRSDGQCLFVMPKGKDFESIERMAKET
jgi:type III restriction enzyme